MTLQQKNRATGEWEVASAEYATFLLAMCLAHNPKCNDINRLLRYGKIAYYGPRWYQSLSLAPR